MLTRKTSARAERKGSAVSKSPAADNYSETAQVARQGELCAVDALCLWGSSQAETWVRSQRRHPEWRSWVWDSTIPTPGAHNSTAPQRHVFQGFQMVVRASRNPPPSVSTSPLSTGKSLPPAPSDPWC